MNYFELDLFKTILFFRYNLFYKLENIRCWVAGESLTRLILNLPKINYDVYFPDKENYEKAKKIFYDERFNFVETFYEKPDKTVESFELTIFMFAIDNGELFYAKDFAVNDLLNKKLVINNYNNLEQTFQKALFYLKNGFRFNYNSIIKIL